MTPASSNTNAMTPSDERVVRDLYQHLLDCWNDRAAAGMAALFTDDGNVIGFDGSQMNGPAEIAAVLGQVFADHPTAAYVAKVREVRFLSGEVALLRAVAGMVPPGQTDLKPAVNAIQTVVMVRRDGRWQVAMYQNTPAAFHGRPELSEALTNELRTVLRASKGVR